MQSVPDVLSHFRSSGKKVTKTRKMLLQLFLNQHAVLSVPEIQKKLAREGIKLHKTSIYREIEFLLQQNILKTVSMESSALYYESALASHHHHAVCSSCGEVEKIDVSDLERKIQAIEQQIATTGFLVSDHALEFHGTCKECI